MKFSFRKFFKASLLTAAFAAASLGVYSYEVEPNTLKTTTYDVNTGKWPQGAPPLHIALAADFHVGSPSVSLKRLADIVDRINDLKADIIVLPGDFVTMVGDDRVIGGTYVKPDDIAAVLKNLHAPLGVYATLGNHDRMNDPDGMRRALEAAGIRVLENDTREIKSPKYDFWIAGLSDDTTSKPDWKAVEKKITNDAPVVLIMHDPGVFVEKIDRPAVTLAAHTHGGQIVIPFIEKYLQNPYSRAPMKYLYGHVSEDGREMIVTSGIGTSIVPLRFGAPREIVDVALQNPAPPKPIS